MRFLTATDREQGTALLLALVVLILISVVSSLVASTVTLEMRLARDETSRVRCSALADAALARALAELSRSRAYQGQEGEQLAGGTLSVRVTRPSGSADGRRVVATGRYGGRARSLEALVSFDPAGRPRVSSWRVMTRQERESGMSY